ncbi:hypothetical protein [Streptomyces violaceusniger]|uniref:hypothetical protein n=1 Tax=Streptomyces violaceusniger TaxID=68280 RepID=UPI003680807B
MTTFMQALAINRYVRMLEDDDYQAELYADLRDLIADARVVGTERLTWYLGRARPENRPAMLWEAWRSGKLLPRVLPEVLGGTWSIGKQGTVPLDQWRAMFDEAGYTQDTRPHPRPAKPIELWRAADDEHRDGWFWTSYIQYAQMVAEVREEARLWRTVAPPEAILCRNVGITGGWDEFAVDTRELTIHEADPPEPLTLTPGAPRPDHIPANHF